MDLVIPDVELSGKESATRVRGYFITHGHEDHIGAVPYIVRKDLPAPLYGTRLTLALCEHKLKEHRLLGSGAAERG